MHEINDIALVGGRAPRARRRLRPLGRRRALDRRRGWPSGSASSSRPSSVADVWLGVIQIFRDYGYRRLRTKARLKFLLADWGPEKFREVLETEYLGAPLPDGPAGAQAARARATTSACTSRRTAASTSAPPRSSAASRGAALAKLADLIEAARLRRACAPPRTRSSWSSTSPEDRRRAARRRARRARPVRPPEPRSAAARSPAPASSSASSPSSRPRPPRRPPSPSSSAGSPTIDLPHPDQPARQRLPQLLRPHPDRRHRPQGQLICRRPTASRRPGFQVHLGGGLASADREEAGLGRTVRGLKVTADGPRRLRRARRAPLPRRPRRRSRRDVRRVGAPRRRGGAAMSAASTSRPPRRRASHRCALAHDELRGPRRGRAHAELGSLTDHEASAAEVVAWVARNFRRMPRPSPARWPTPCCRTWSRTELPGRRRAVPRHRLPLRRDVRDARRGRPRPRRQRRRRAARADRGRAGRRVRRASSSPATPACAARCARSRPLQARARRATRLWFTGVRREEAPTRTNTPLVHVGRAQRAGQGQPARGLDLRRAARLRRRPPACP